MNTPFEHIRETLMSIINNRFAFAHFAVGYFQDQIAAFLNQHPDAHALTLNDPWGRPAGAGRQILPGEAGMDGFFYAALVKAPSI